MKTLDYIISIRGRPSIGRSLKPYVIAEVGTNHNQSIDIARRLVRSAANAGCDCAKFQIYEAEEIVSGSVRAKDYGLDKLYGDISAREMFENFLKTPKNWFPELKDLCHELGMDCAVTIHGEDGLRWVKEMEPDLIKIASMDHTNLPFLASLVNAFKMPILISFGMANLEDIDSAMEILGKHKGGVGIFHCCAVYPPNEDELNLSNISFLEERFSVPIGFSDHTIGINSALLGRDYGAAIFEKHLTEDRNQLGPDHSFAIEPSELGTYTAEVKLRKSKITEMATSFISPSERELCNRTRYLKSIVTRRSLPKSHIITADDIYLARPGTGIMPADYMKIIGRTTRRLVEAESPLHYSDLE
jgi:sialic acid synthase SpsE